jgi:alkanesulfonate monooxygenase
MSVQFIGAIGTSAGSEIRASAGPVIDKPYLETFVQAHEAAGFDRVLIGYFSAAPDGFQIAAYAAQRTRRIHFLLAHRPGFVAPTLAARQLATLDQFSDGRLAVHIIMGGVDEDQKRDGDFLTKVERYARTDDYLDLVKKTWTQTEPFDHAGPYYTVVDSFSAVKPVQQPHIPVYFGGSSDEAIAVAGKHADVFALWGETLEQTAETIARVRAAAKPHGRDRHIQFSLSIRPILAPTEKEAWARADEILTAARALCDAGPPPTGILRHRPATPQNVGSLRLLEAAAGGRVRDKRLWTEFAALSGAAGNSTALVGTGEQVAESLLDYYDLGISHFLIRGFHPLEDVIDYGQNLIPLVRSEIAARNQTRTAVA